ncbi:MAG: ferritin [Candidatus Omnitrophota bacterium]|nr:ferritin [Candidatus Omnitrophota bacterium]MDZ4242660.1 ferritin [Candidatus Omnitrophota bacterium]
MAEHFKSHYMPGSAHWFKIQSNEEFQHAMKFNEYLCARGGKVVLTALEAPKAEWKSFLSVLEEAYEQELKVSALIYDLVDLAREERDYATEIMLQWFVSEQVEEEETAKNNVEKFKLVKNTVEGIAVFDQDLGQRK